MSNELVTVTIQVPPPPDTHDIVPGRVPLGGEEHFLFVPLNDAWVLQKGPSKGDKYRILAFPKPRPKRLLTPAELAGKWLHYRASDFCEQVIAFNNPQEMVRTAMGSCTVQSLVDNGATYSTTPDGPRLPLEVEDKL